MSHPLGGRDTRTNPLLTKLPSGSTTAAVYSPPPAGSVTGPQGTFSDPYTAYQHTGLAGYGKTFDELRQAAVDRNKEFNDLRAQNDARIKAAQGGLDLSQGIWGGMDDYSLTGALGGLANSALGRQLQDALVKKYGSTNAMNQMINKYWAGFVDDPAKHGNFNTDYWQKLGTLSEMGHNITPYLASGAQQHSGTWADFGMNDAERQAMANTPASLAAQGLSGVIGGLSKNNGGAWQGNTPGQGSGTAGTPGQPTGNAGTVMNSPKNMNNPLPTVTGQPMTPSTSPLNNPGSLLQPPGTPYNGQPYPKQQNPNPLPTTPMLNTSNNMYAGGSPTFNENQSKGPQYSFGNTQGGQYRYRINPSYFQRG